MSNKTIKDVEHLTRHKSLFVDQNSNTLLGYKKRTSAKNYFDVHNSYFMFIISLTTDQWISDFICYFELKVYAWKLKQFHCYFTFFRKLVFSVKIQISHLASFRQKSNVCPNVG